MFFIVDLKKKIGFLLSWEITVKEGTDNNIVLAVRKDAKKVGPHLFTNKRTVY